MALNLVHLNNNVTGKKTKSLNGLRDWKGKENAGWKHPIQPSDTQVWDSENCNN